MRLAVPLCVAPAFAATRSFVFRLRFVMRLTQRLMVVPRRPLLGGDACRFSFGPSDDVIVRHAWLSASLDSADGFLAQHSGSHLAGRPCV